MLGNGAFVKNNISPPPTLSLSLSGITLGMTSLRWREFCESKSFVFPFCFIMHYLSEIVAALRQRVIYLSIKMERGNPSRACEKARLFEVLTCLRYSTRRRARPRLLKAYIRILER